MPETIRAFIAVHLPIEWRASLRAIQAQLQTALPRNSVRWTVPEQIHLSLKFLGNISIASLPELEAAGRTIAENSTPFRLRAEGLGSFPNPTRPRVLWVGLAGDVTQIQTLQASVDTTTRHWSERVEAREFRPHLTLGRVREISAVDARKVGNAVQISPAPVLGEWQVDHITLMRSELSSAGAVHTPLASWRLAG